MDHDHKPLEFLKEIPCFSELKNDTLLKLESVTLIKKYKRGEIILFVSDLPGHILIIIEGSYAVYVSYDGIKKQILSKGSKGAIINPEQIISCDSPLLPGYVMALSDATALRIPKYFIKELILEDKNFALELITLLSSKVVKTNYLCANMSLKSVKSRLAGYLIHQADSNQNHLMITYDDIAAEIGSVRDVIGRLLSEFVREGLIKKVRHQFILVNRKKLSDIFEQID